MDEVKLSKIMSQALRHTPKKYHLELKDGWISVDELLEAIRKYTDLTDVTKEAIMRVVELSLKKRFEIDDNMIRARYGHSFEHKISYVKSKPPKVLYHGTSDKFLPSIMENGLCAMKRQYVHLSSCKDVAIEVGKRKSVKPVIVVVDSELAFEEGTSFYSVDGQVWLANHIPAKYITYTLAQKS